MGHARSRVLRVHRGRCGGMTPATFKTFRTRLGLSQTRAAELLGISRSLWQKYESGERKCDRDRLYGLAMAAVLFGLPPFTGGTENE